MNHIKVKTFSLIFLLFTSFAYSNSNEPYNLGISVFKDYENIKKLLQEKQKQNDRAAVLLSNVKLYSIDYSPSPFVRTNRPNPSFPTQQAQDGIEGYAVVTFNINDDGSIKAERLTIDSTGRVIIANGGSGGTADVNADNFVVKNYTSSGSCGISILNADNLNSTLYFVNTFSK